MCGIFIIFWLAVAAFGVWIVLRNRPDVRQRVSSIFTGARVGTDGAEGILRDRLARGEIDAEEYERAMRILRG